MNEVIKNVASEECIPGSVTAGYSCICMLLHLHKCIEIGQAKRQNMLERALYVGKSISKLQMDIEVKQEY
jgi:hypothetical protein